MKVIIKAFRLISRQIDRFFNHQFVEDFAMIMEILGRCSI